MDELSKVAMGRAYWLPLPLNYMTATGAVAARWGQFEMQFLGFIKILSRPPQLADLGAKIPGSFNDKAHLLRRLARGAFPNCPTLTEKLCEFSTRSNRICKKRNAIIHGFWFDMTHFDPARGVTLMTMPDGTGDFYSVTLNQIEALAVKIEDLLVEGVQLTFPPDFANPAQLTSDELDALREYHKNYPRPPQEVPVRRDPNRKGTSTQPEPFRA